MKKVTTVLSLILAVGLSSTLANKEMKVDPRVIETFQEEFSFAENVTWMIHDHYTSARFTLYDQAFIAYYSPEGELISTARNILFRQLPLSVIQKLEDKYDKAVFTSLVEVNKDGATTYFIKAEKKKAKLLLKASPLGTITVAEKKVI